MKLLRAEFENFRLLRDLKLEFSSKDDMNLTVIRAANESGKTTILHALQWALYGDAALPLRGKGFRLHPIDWDIGESKRVQITATVEFELTYHRLTAGKLRETRRRLRLVRCVSEDVENPSRRPPSTARLFEMSDGGATPIDAPESLINEELPLNLREVFFTDGDRVLSFIDADVDPPAKRERVQRALRSLLGLGVIEDAIKHIHKSEAAANKRLKQIGNGNELSEIASRIEGFDEEGNKLEKELEDTKQQLAAFEDQMKEIDHKITEALRNGDKEKLREEYETTKRNLVQLNNQLIAAKKEHSELFRSRSIATDLLAPLLSRAYEKLEELHNQGKIPNVTIPVLQNRLSTKLCICGETLEASDPGGNKRRAHIQKLIDDSQQADEIQEIITDLYYSVKPLQGGGDAVTSAWLNDYDKVFERRDGLQGLRTKAGRKYRALERQLDALPDTDIKGLRETQRQYKSQIDRLLAKRIKEEIQLAVLHREREDLDNKRDRLLREQKHGAHIRAELDVAQDVRKVLKNAHERLTNEELDKVSKLMNHNFLEMIGADSQQKAIIQRAEINRKFDIIVYGPNSRTLSPDRDLNGAARRALTLAFILALTEVSKVEAPNFIDTPLGMTSGYVKRAILKTAVRKSAQLVLFLTPAEIAGCEEIIDEKAGAVFTLTNSAHYPKMLVNNPGVTKSKFKILRCECNHRTWCQLCRRRINIQVALETAS